MIIYRVAKKEYAGNLKPSGRPARWNSANQEMVYTAESLSLACLEIMVHTNGLLLRTNRFSCVVIEVPETVFVDKLDMKLLPSDYSGQTPYIITQTIGDAWLNKSAHAVLRVPSSIIPGEFNYLLNPRHNVFQSISIIEIKPFTFDTRLK